MHDPPDPFIAEWAPIYQPDSILHRIPVEIRLMILRECLVASPSHDIRFGYRYRKLCDDTGDESDFEYFPSVDENGEEDLVDRTSDMSSEWSEEELDISEEEDIETELSDECHDISATRAADLEQPHLCKDIIHEDIDVTIQDGNLTSVLHPTPCRKGHLVRRGQPDNLDCSCLISSPTPITAAILGVCRQFYLEGINMLYNENTFIFPDLADMKELFLWDLRAEHYPRLRSIRFYDTPYKQTEQVERERKEKSIQLYMWHGLRFLQNVEFVVDWSDIVHPLVWRYDFTMGGEVERFRVRCISIDADAKAALTSLIRVTGKFRG